MAESLDAWIERERSVAASELLASISATQIVKHRHAFGRSVRAARGSIVASINLADWDPDPDYFFHWFRDSALVIDAVRRLWRAGVVDDRAIGLFDDFVRFSLMCARIDGRSAAAREDRVTATQPDHRKFLRSNEELAAIFGPAALAETRVDADGTIDITKWARPQNDGPALRALATLRWLDDLRGRGEAPRLRDAQSLAALDLDFTAAVWREPCFDLWEEDLGQHYYTRSVQAAALTEGARWRRARGEDAAAQDALAAADRLLVDLDSFWSEKDGWFRARGVDAATAKDPDVSVILAALHSGRAGDRHGPADPRIATTFAQLCAHFRQAFDINKDPSQVPALGRYYGDSYFGGGAWYLAIFAAAELCYRDGKPSSLARGDAFLSRARSLIPNNGHLSEQIDRDSGTQTSAKRLAWSYAAFVTCIDARDDLTVANGAVRQQRF